MINYCLHQQSKFQIAKLEDLLKALTQKWIQDLTKEMSYV